MFDKYFEKIHTATQKKVFNIFNPTSHHQKSKKTNKQQQKKRQKKDIQLKKMKKNEKRLFKRE